MNSLKHRSVPIEVSDASRDKVSPAAIPRVAFVTSHPIQYQVPVFRHLAQREDLEFEVFFAMLPDAATQGAGFGVHFEWDIPLLEGYPYQVLQNIAKRPNVTTFRGCDTPDVGDELRRSNIDVVVVNGWVVKTCLQTLWACRKLRIPCIVRGEANNLRPRPWWKRVLQRQLVRRYDAYLPIGSASREFYRSYGIPEQQMFDARYCVENERFARAAEEARPRRAELRRQWGIPDQAVCFLFCGKFEPKKHPMELLESFRAALQRQPNAQTLHLLMVGDGQLRYECDRIANEIRDLATRHSLLAAPPVTFTGFLNQSQIVNAYVAADVLTLPSDHGETWGLVVNEAMACGLPAIVSDQVGCAADLIVEGTTGWVFPFGQWNRLADLLLELSNNPNRTWAMGSDCKDLIRNYSPAITAEGIAAAVMARSEKNATW